MLIQAIIVTGFKFTEIAGLPVNHLYFTLPTGPWVKLSCIFSLVSICIPPPPTFQNCIPFPQAQSNPYERLAYFIDMLIQEQKLYTAELFNSIFAQWGRKRWRDEKFKYCEKPHILIKLKGKISRLQSYILSF